MRDHVSAEEEAAIDSLLEHEQLAEGRSDLVQDGDRPTSSTLIVEGLAARYKTLPSGARQITALHFPGDFVDLHSFLLKKMDHSVLALTRCRIVRAPHVKLKAISETYPHLMRLFSLLTLIDGSIHRQWLVAMGRSNAVSQAAHLLCETYVQLKIVNRVRDHEFDLPITQYDLGDMLGLSSVHTNRVLQDLRRNGLLQWNGEAVKLLDWPRLVRLAAFDDTYLHLVKEPR